MAKVLCTLDGILVRGLAVWGSDIYFTADDYVVRKLTETGEIHIVAGTPGEPGCINGPGIEEARFNIIGGIAVCNDGSLIIADAGNRRIRKISPDGVVTTVAGSGVFGSVDGAGAEAQFKWPCGVAVRADGSIVVADSDEYRIRLISAGFVTTMAGSGAVGYLDGSAAEAQFFVPCGVTVCPDGAVLVCDVGNHRVRRIAAGSSAVSTVAGSWGSSTACRGGFGFKFDDPTSIAVDTAGHALVGGTDGCIRKINLATGEVTTVGNGFGSKLAIDQNGNIVFATAGNGSISRLTGSPGIGPGFRSGTEPRMTTTRQIVQHYPVWTRECVTVILHISARSMNIAIASLPYLPPQMWHEIILMFPRHQIGVSPLFLRAPEQPNPRLMGDSPEGDSE